MSVFLADTAYCAKTTHPAAVKMKLFGCVLFAAFLATGFYRGGLHGGQTGNGFEILKQAEAAGGKVNSPTGTAPDRYVYYPGTEELKKDEIRLIACGTGLPAARRDQAATCFLAEVGNADKFLFDIGTGSMVNVAALMIPYDYLNKIFLTHLHTDHWGDLATLWAGGWTAGRTGPLRILGAHRGNQGHGNGICGGSLLVKRSHRRANDRFS